MYNHSFYLTFYYIYKYSIKVKKILQNAILIYESSIDIQQNVIHLSLKLWAEGRIRTDDHLIGSQAFWPTELLLQKYCLGDRTRTCDHGIPNAVRYQLRHTQFNNTNALRHFVQMKGVEPIRLMTSEPKSNAYTNFATSANE